MICGGLIWYSVYLLARPIHKIASSFVVGVKSCGLPKVSDMSGHGREYCRSIDIRVFNFGSFSADLNEREEWSGVVCFTYSKILQDTL